MIIKTIFAVIVLSGVAVGWVVWAQENLPLNTDSAVTSALSKCYEHSPRGLTFPSEIQRECERLKEEFNARMVRERSEERGDDFAEVRRVYQMLEQ